tara:strand:- start:95 stop:241 length:147 start_codon:yes stop_codon:yes gene_type:complete
MGVPPFNLFRCQVSMFYLSVYSTICEQLKIVVITKDGLLTQIREGMSD